jgi:hypothetical protein
MPEFLPNKELRDIAKEELKKFSEDESYPIPFCHLTILIFSKIQL